MRLFILSRDRGVVIKKLIVINGTMGVGKTTTCLKLQKLLPKNVFLDGDWCWHMEPFVVTKETKTMVMNNIAYLLNNFIQCSEYENIIFCWVMHEQEIIDEVLMKLDLLNCKKYIFSLICSEHVLINRLKLDIANNTRTQDIIDRSIPRLLKNTTIDSVKIDTSELTPFETANKIIDKIGKA